MAAFSLESAVRTPRRSPQPVPRLSPRASFDGELPGRSAQRSIPAVQREQPVRSPGVRRRAAGVIRRTLEQHLRVQAQSIPRGRIGTPHDIARAVTFFTADDADFVTGQVLYVSGGPHG
ncbi:SDR family oxidoreductase [Amycolatopsis sp. lyj-112]|uniref:SDR family oxidoreductase n=1 Tax=Amycolatopsis sp. lyj-112 TaxID=2789288 RepID=UPI00397AF7EF